MSKNRNLLNNLSQSLKIVFFSLYFFPAKLSLRLLAKMAATARLTSPLLLRSSCMQDSRGNPIAIMFVMSLSLKQ